MPRQGQKKGDRDNEYKPGKEEEDIADVDLSEVKTPKPTIKPAKVTKGPPAKGTPKPQTSRPQTPKPQTPKGSPKVTPKVTPSSTPKPLTAGAYKKPSPPPNTSTAAPSSTTIKTPSPSDPYFCCRPPLPVPSSFPPALQPFFTFLINSLSQRIQPPPFDSVPSSKTYYRFSHLSLTTCTEVHRYFLSVDPRNETGGIFVEGSEEGVLEKAGALDEDGAVGRRQDVMILSRNARCEQHMKEGFWYVLMRVEQIDEEAKDANVGVFLAEEMDHDEIDLDLYT